MARSKKWTNEEDKVLVQLIEKYPHNLNKAFLMASGKLERTKSACQFRWYQHLGNPNSPKHSSVCFTILSKRKQMVDRKNYIEGRSKRKPKNNKVSIWKKILNLLRL